MSKALIIVIIATMAATSHTAMFFAGERKGETKGMESARHALLKRLTEEKCVFNFASDGAGITSSRFTHFDQDGPDITDMNAPGVLPK